MTAGINIYKLIIKKKKNKHEKIILLAKSKFNRIEVLISIALVDSVISDDEFFLLNNILIQYSKMKEDIKNSNNK